MKRYHWKSKPHAVVNPRRGQKYRLGQLLAELHCGRKPSVELLSDVFGVSTAVIYQTMRDARPNQHSNGRGCNAKGNGHTRPANGNGHSPAMHSTVVEPELPLSMPAVELVVGPHIDIDPWSIAEDLVHTHGPGLVFDRVIVPHL